MQSIILFAIACLVGYYLSAFFSIPVMKDGEKKPNRLPSLRIWNIEILPCVRIHFKNSTIWFHHWFYYSLFILGALLLYDNIMHFTTAKAAAGASVGGILQGLTYPDRFKFKHPRLRK